MAKSNFSVQVSKFIAPGLVSLECYWKYFIQAIVFYSQNNADSEASNVIRRLLLFAIKQSAFYY